MSVSAEVLIGIMIRVLALVVVLIKDTKNVQNEISAQVSIENRIYGIKLSMLNQLNDGERVSVVASDQANAVYSHERAEDSGGVNENVVEEKQSEDTEN